MRIVSPAPYLATILFVATWICAGTALAQPAKQPSAQPTPVVANQPQRLTQPVWKDLSTAQQTALKPLSAHWDTMAVSQKRKWISVAVGFDKLPAAQQAKLHGRMTEWAALSPQQRSAARQNFAQHRELTDGLTPEQRKAQWEAYQALSPEEKRKLAQGASQPTVAGAAPAPRPQPVLKKEPAPEFGTAKVLAKAKSAPQTPPPGKKIAVAPHVAEQGSILPGPQASSAKP